VRSTSPRILRADVLAAAVFVALALAATAVIHATGREIADTGGYQGYAESLESGLLPYRDFDLEYPPGALPVFALPALAGSDETAYFWAFAWVMAIAGAVGIVISAAALRRLGRSQKTTRRVLGLLAVSPIAFGGVLLTRFDLLPAVLVAGAMLLLLSDRPRLAVLILGTAAAVKWYPLALLPLVAAWTWRHRGRREAALCSALGVGVLALAYLPFVLLAPGEAASSVWGQVSRPLQIESLGAGVLLLLDHAVDLGVAVETSHGSQNLAGGVAGGVAFALGAASIAALCWLWIRFARGEATPERLVRYSAAVLVALVAFSKVLSPQFLVWLGFPLALVAARRGAAAGACFAVAAVATAVWFPALYFELSRDRDPFVAALVVIRGLALAAAFAMLALPIRSATRALEQPLPGRRESELRVEAMGVRGVEEPPASGERALLDAEPDESFAEPSPPDGRQDVDIGEVRVDVAVRDGA
jgi:hypothetical protein